MSSVPVGQLIGLTETEVSGVRRQLSEASLLPSRVYTDRTLFELERDRVFGHSWLPVCHLSQLSEPGSYVTRTLAGEPLVAVRDREIRVLSNVCRHRNSVLTTGSGKCPGNRIVCPYHGWVYTLDGRLLGAPYMDQALHFEKRNTRLPEFRTEIWQGFVFVNFDRDAPSLAPQLTELAARIAPYRFEEKEAVEIRRRTMAWNWKISLENFSEAYHQPWIHPATAEHAFPATLAEYQDVTGPYGLFWLWEKDRSRVPTFFAAPEGLTDDLLRSVTVFNVYPVMHCLTDPATPLMLDFNILSEEEHELVWTVLLPKGSLGRPDFDEQMQRFKAFIEPILLEDVEVCTRVGAGARSRYTAQGRLSHMEKTVHQFQNWWLDQMLTAR